MTLPSTTAGQTTTVNHRVCVAPMMAWTTPQQRFFMRLITRHAMLYTEMLTTGAILHGDRQRLLAFDVAEHPVALQIGGSDPAAMAQCARIGEAAGFDEININVCCPSDRVQRGAIGACMMASPQRMADCVAAMRAAVAVPVTIKTRIGIDRQDDAAFLHEFARLTHAAGCPTLMVHARKAWLSGLSPKENRNVPPLDYQRVFQLKRDLPDLEIVINGGIQDLDTAENHLRHVDGVMLGRVAYQRPYLLADVDRRFYGDSCAPRSRHAVARALQPYIESQRAAGVPLKHTTRHILGLFHGQPGGRRWRRTLSEQAHFADANFSVVERALAAVPDNSLTQPEAA